MALLTKRERNEIKKSSVLRYYDMEQQFYAVTQFYPAQRLTITVEIADIINIMNCNYAQANEIIKKVRKKAGKEGWTSVRMSEFCECMEIEDTLMQVFLASLKTENPLPPVKTKETESDFVIADRRMRKIVEVVEDLRKGIMESDETMQKRVKLWNELNPYGEPMYKRPGFYRVIIRPFEIAQIFGIHLRTAQAMLHYTREKAELPKRAYVSIKKFCEINYLDEEDLRISLAELHGDKEETDQ